MLERDKEKVEFMKISLPFIDTQRHFAAMMALYDAKVAEYNAQVAIARDSGDASRQFLKSAHRELWQDLIRAAKGEMAKMLFIFQGKDTQSLIARKPGSALILMTNRKRMSNRTKKSEVTIYRLLERLIDAGIIEKKINHGTQRDFELHLNREMVPVSDYKNERFDPLLEILKNTTDSAIQETLRSICTPCSSNLNNFNNEIITENSLEHEVESAPLILSNEQSGTFYGNTGDPSPGYRLPVPADSAKINISTTRSQLLNAFGVPVAPPDSTEINISNPIDAGAEYGKKIEQARKREEERTREYSIMLVEFVISILFSTKNIFTSERERAYKLSEYYFEKFSNATDCELALRNYRDRVRIVQRWLENHPEYDFSNIYPAAYMHPENYSSGFINTGKWLKKDRENRELQYKQRKLKTEEATVMYAIKRMKKWRNESSYNYWRSYVINKAPAKVAQFEEIAKIELKRIALNAN